MNSTSKWAGRVALALVVLSFGAFLTWVNFFGIWPSDPAAEEARRTQCQANLKRIYQALVAYRDEKGSLPSSLQELLRRYPNEGIVCECPSAARRLGPALAEYEYHPESWGSKRRAVVCDPAESHPAVIPPFIKRLLLCRLGLGPARYGVYSDGSVRNMLVGSYGKPNVRCCE